jgi:hypothetical protein
MERIMKGAVFTIVKNERLFLPVWLRYYSQFFASEDIYVIDNGSDDGSTSDDGRYVRVNHQSDYSFDVQFLLARVMQFQRSLLLKWKYDFVLFAEADEIVVPAASGQFAAHLARNKTVKCVGMEVLHESSSEPDLDWSKPLLAQRRGWTRMPDFDKPLLSRAPLTWEYGFHNCAEEAAIDPALVLIHLRRIDFNSCYERLCERRLWKRPPGQAANMAWQWMLSMDSFAAWFMSPNMHSMPIPERYKNVV